MVLILKELGKKDYKVVKLSTLGYGPDCRIYDLANDVCCDNQFNRTQFYRAIIEKMIEDENDIKSWNSTEVPNTLHDRIIRFFRNKNINIYLVEIDFNRFTLIP